MTRDEIRDHVIEIACEHLKVERNKVTEATSFVGDLRADSLTLAELGMDIEDEFDIDIPENAAANIGTVGAAVDFVVRQMAAAGSA